jgi:hypothetical protein
LNLSLSELLARVDSRLSSLAPRVQAATGSGALQGARATPAPATVKTPAPGQPERGIVRYLLELPVSNNRGLTRDGPGPLDGGLILRDTLTITLTAPVHVTSPGASRDDLLDAEALILAQLTDPSWARPLRLSYADSRRSFSPQGQGAQAQILLTFTCDRQFP